MSAVRWPRSALLGLLAIAVIAVAVPVARARHSGATPVPIAPLTATDRRVIAAEEPLVTALPQAIAEIPAAASDASGGRVSNTQAAAIIASTPALAALSHAITNPTQTTAALTTAYRDVRAGRAPMDAEQVEAALTTLQSAVTQVDAAIRLVAARSSRVMSPTAERRALDRDPRVRPLAGVVDQWPEIYGVFALVAQRSAGG